ncbi:MAG TPA: 50S ribosomal protein L6 [Dehalococcoidia bacterium]|nr:50S ribosomal protein L6 [Dehalococcoidia bacterium]
MSRVGKRPIPVPSEVSVDVNGTAVTVTGPRGTLHRDLHPEMQVTMADGTLTVSRPSESRLHRSLHGLTRTLVANMVQGVTEGFRKELEIVGVGYRAQNLSGKLVMQLGFSHPVEVIPAPGITFEVVGNNRVIISGIDKEQVGQQAAVIRKWRPPEPYKGKGLRYAGEVVARKAGKGGRIGGKKGR